MRKCLDNSAVNEETSLDISPYAYLDYVKRGAVKDPNYLFLADIVLNISDSISLFRTGVRSKETRLYLDC